jgi:tetratricopeptide (TPR) repeat protein
MFTVQTEIADEIVHRLQPRLQARTRLEASRRPPDPEAYELYLQGRYFLNKWILEGTRKSVAYLERAAAKDPNFAAAYASLAHAYFHVGWLEAAPRMESYPKVKAAAEKALRIDSAAAEAHRSMAFVKWYFEWDWNGAEWEYQRTLELNPSLAEAWAWYGWLLTFLGRNKEADGKDQRALELDPVSVPIMGLVAENYYYAHSYDQSMAMCRKILEMDPSFSRALIVLGWVFVQKEMYPEAIETFHKGTFVRRVPEPAFLAIAYARAGQKGEALRILEEWTDAARQRHVPPDGMARIYAGLGDNRHALDWLEKAYNEHEYLANLKAGPAYDSLRQEPRFVSLLTKLGLGK